jgi:hypothetical protein
MMVAEVDGHRFAGVVLDLENLVRPSRQHA